MKPQHLQYQIHIQNTFEINILLDVISQTVIHVHPANKITSQTNYYNKL